MVSQQEDEPPPQKKAKQEEQEEPCRVCLGVLEERFMEPALESICSTVCEAGYDADHFTVAVSLPVSLALRTHSVNLYLSSKLDTFCDDEVVPIKQVWKWLFPQRIEQKLGKKLVTGDACEFYAELQFDFADDEKELACLRTMCEKEYSNRAKNHRKYHMGLVTRQGAEKSLGSVTEKHFRANYPVPPDKSLVALTSSVKLYHNNIFVAGRYNKYSRHLPQTPWIVDGEKRMPSSVEELILNKIQAAFKFDGAKFSSSGREDVDVRTLGRGRPFMFEIANSRKTFFTPKELAAMQLEINQSSQDIRVRDLQVVPKSSIKALKEGEDQKRKTYTALCVLPPNCCTSVAKVKNTLENKGEVEVSQRTPIRVLHRRPDAIRKRTVHHMQIEPLQKKSSVKLFRLTLSTQAGTYVKEFVHGDFGRTVPNLRQILGCDVDILALDVEEIDLDWPPAIDSKE